MTKHQIVVAYDFTASAELALLRALDVACSVPRSVLHFLTVVDPRGDYRTADRVAQDLRDHVRIVIDARHPPDDLELYVHAPLGEPVAEILALAEKVGADLVVVGSHRKSALGRFLLGSVSEGVLHRARCPVLIARPKGYRDMELPKAAATVAVG